MLSPRPEAQPVDQHERTQRGPAREQRFQQLVSQHDHIASLNSIQIVEPPPFLQRQITDLVQLGLRSQDLAAPAGKFADLVQIPPRNEWNRIPDMSRQLDIAVVLRGQKIRLRRAHISLHRRRPPGKQEHDVLPKLRQFPLVARPEAFTHANQQQKRAHPPGDAKHREKGPQFMSPKVPKYLSENVRKRAHKERDVPRVSWLTQSPKPTQ
jgi:hypothetical protein